MERVEPNARGARCSETTGATRGVARAPRHLALAALIVLLAVAAYWPSLRGEFVWDDHSEIVANAEIKAPDGLRRIWLGEGTLDYFPLKSTVQWLQWHAWGDRPLGYRVTNLVLHIAGALLAWRLFAKLGLRGAWIGGMVFAVHPLAVESVAWIAELKNVLSLPPLLLAACAWIDFDATRSRRAWAAAFAWFLVAALAKSSVVMFPVLLLLFAWWRRGRIELRDAKAAAPFFAAALALGLATIWFQHHRAIGTWHIEAGGPLERVGRAGVALWFYAANTLLPFGLLPIYPRSVVEVAPWGQVLAWAAWLGLGLGAWRRRATWGRHVLLGVGWFALNLLPVLGLVDMSFLYFAWVADHFAYVALVAGAGAIAALAGQMRAPARIAAAVVGAIFLVETRGHAALFTTEETLWRHTLARNPAAWLGHSNLAAVQIGRGEFATALEHARRAIELKPDHAAAHRNIAAALGHLGRLDEAIAAVREADRHDRPGAELHVFLASALLRAGRSAEAVAHAEQAVAVAPHSAKARQYLALALYLAGRPAESLPHYEAALRTAPDAETRTNYGVALAGAGRFRDAIPVYEAALRESPNSINAHFSLGIALAQEGRSEDARRELDATLRLNPRHAEAHFQLGELHRRASRRAEAITAYRTALQLRPDFPEARTQLEALEKTPSP